MGASGSSAVVAVDQDEDANKYIVPYWINMSDSQVSALMAVRVNHGVPFRLNQNGDGKPRGVVKQVSIVDAAVGIRRNSVKAIYDGRSNSTIQFVYDAKVPLELTIAFETCQEKISRNISDWDTAPSRRRKSVSCSGNRHKLSAGMNQLWSSAGVTEGDALAIGSNSITVDHEVYKVLKKLVTAYEEYAKSEASELTNDPGRRAKRNELVLEMRPIFPSSGYSEESGCENSRESMVTSVRSVFSLEGMVTSVPASQPNSMRESKGGDNDNFGNANGPDDSTDVVGTGKYDNKRAAKTLTLKCCQQSVVLADDKTKEFIISELYGVKHEQPVGAVGARNVDDIQISAISPHTLGDGSNNDSDSNDCVICLCEPREYACLPCRHLSMCSSCVVDLTSHANKCPICRKKAEVFLKVPFDSYK